MNELRIVFMGTPEFAVTSLEALLHAGCQVVAVVTAPDRPAGRGMKLRESAVKASAVKHQIPVLQPTKLKDPDFLGQLAGFKPDLQVVVAFRMLPEAVWKLPGRGTFNLHASLLPDYRGAAPINWAIINGETRTGVTTFFIDEKIDTGRIILQEPVLIGPQETAGELHDRMQATGAELVVRTVRQIESGSVKAFEQPTPGPGRQAPKLFRDDCRISWDRPAVEIHNKIRGLSPYPGAWTRLQNGNGQLDVKILRARVSNKPAGGLPAKLERDGMALFAGTNDHPLEILEWQPEGKRRMNIADWLNGQSLEANAIFL